MAPEIVTLAEIASILKISKHTAYKNWHNWRDYGVRVLQDKPNAVPRFYLSDILKMMEQPK
jgi:transposase